MDSKPQDTAANPLTKYFRQPAIYVKLPSNGQYWPADALNLPVTGELPVYPLTTRDEITLKTPDALMNGAGVVDVIQSCCPNILNAWAMPNIDIDSVLIAIRIASYGHEMDFDTKCPHCTAENSYAQDLRNSLASIKTPNYSESVVTDNLLIKLKPAPYFVTNKNNQINFEEQKMLQALENVELDPEMRSTEIQGSMRRLIDIGLDNLTASTEHIATADGDVVTDPKHIREFYTNADTNTVKAVNEKNTKITTGMGMDDMHVTCDSCKKTYNVPIEFNYSSFFGNGF